jgi:hypothetical protein
LLTSSIPSFGDGAYNDAVLQAKQHGKLGLEFLAPVKRTQQPARSPIEQRLYNRLRLICETVNAQLQEQFHLSKHYAKSTWGWASAASSQSHGAQDRNGDQPTAGTPLAPASCIGSLK